MYSSVAHGVVLFYVNGKVPTPIIWYNIERVNNNYINKFTFGTKCIKTFRTLKKIINHIHNILPVIYVS